VGFFWGCHQNYHPLDRLSRFDPFSLDAVTQLSLRMHSVTPAWYSLAIDQ